LIVNGFNRCQKKVSFTQKSAWEAEVGGKDLKLPLKAEGGKMRKIVWATRCKFDCVEKGVQRRPEWKKSS